MGTMLVQKAAAFVVGCVSSAWTLLPVSVKKLVVLLLEFEATFPLRYSET